MDNFYLVEISHTESGEEARERAAELTDDQLLAWCHEISNRDFGEDFRPDLYSWLNGSREGMIDFIVGSFL
jgi:hypothetical protein